MAEMQYKPTQRGPRRYGAPQAHPQFMGNTVLGSGSTAVTVSTSAVRSASMLLTGIMGRSGGGNIFVNSIVHGVSFAFGRSGAALPWDERVSWEIIQREWRS